MGKCLEKEFVMHKFHLKWSLIMLVFLISTFLGAGCHAKEAHASIATNETTINDQAENKGVDTMSKNGLDSIVGFYKLNQKKLMHLRILM